ncbi:hypothetical protein H9P43_003540 [Blastocladiella emersonii ATCC 22665]|nr:hypothetical protein H9P43_003540 [Blastocladiella emersonii ATCC 22665]
MHHFPGSFGRSKTKERERAAAAAATTTTHSGRHHHHEPHHAGGDMITPVPHRFPEGLPDPMQDDHVIAETHHLRYVPSKAHRTLFGRPTHHLYEFDRPSWETNPAFAHPHHHIPHAADVAHEVVPPREPHMPHATSIHQAGAHAGEALDMEHLSSTTITVTQTTTEGGGAASSAATTLIPGEEAMVSVRHADSGAGFERYGTPIARPTSASHHHHHHHHDRSTTGNETIDAALLEEVQDISDVPRGLPHPPVMEAEQWVRSHYTETTTAEL